MRLSGNHFVFAFFFSACACLAQPEIRITDLAAGDLHYTLTPAEGTSQYTCRLEWCPDLRAGWTNGWYRPFETQYANTNGVYSAAVPRFFRISCRADGLPPGGLDSTNYVVNAVIPSVVINGVVEWLDTGGGQVYHVEFAPVTGGSWSGQWRYQTNITASSTATGSFRLPMRFRVVAITPDDGVEYPW
jgi:hypothetical protein